jgi:hypothetical protein
MNVYAEKSQLAAIDPTIASETAGEKAAISHTYDSYQKVLYQKILDYHIAEIFLTTVVFGVIVLLRLHR